MREKVINLFFKNLAAYYTENNLSDITFYVFNCSINFRNFFLKVFFSELNDIPEYVEIKREAVSDDKESRIDFKFIINGNIYLIENKIGDRNYHYDQYKKSYPNCKIGFIANYDVSTLDIYDNCKISWKDFSSKLKKFISSIDNEEEKLLLFGYTEYIRGVCKLMEEQDFKPMLSKDINYLLLLFENFILEKRLEGYELNNSKKACGDCYAGKYFKKAEKLFWCGIYMLKECNNIYVALEGKLPCGYTNISESRYIKNIYEDDGYIWAELKDNELKELNSDICYKKKINKLKSFFNEALDLFNTF